MIGLLEAIRERAARDMMPGPWVPGRTRPWWEALVVYCWASDLVDAHVRARM